MFKKQYVNVVSWYIFGHLLNGKLHIRYRFVFLCRSMVITGVTKKLAMIDQLISGIDSFGVLAEIRKHREIMKPLFTLDGATNFLVTSDLLLDHMTIECSPEGSNRKAPETDVHKYFCDYIQEAAIRTGLYN